MSELESIVKLREFSQWFPGIYATENVGGESTSHIIHNYPPVEGMGSVGDDIRGLADEIEAEIAKRFMELPVDVDGVPIRTGDLIEFGEKGERLEVTHFGWTKHGDPTIAYRRPNGTFDCSCIGAECRHVKPRTIEDVLKEVVAETRLAVNPNHWIVEKYAAEIRELLGGDAK